jgi:hypothetical protein
MHVHLFVSCSVVQFFRTAHICERVETTMAIPCSPTWSFEAQIFGIMKQTEPAQETSG